MSKISSSLIGKHARAAADAYVAAARYEDRVMSAPDAVQHVFTREDREAQLAHVESLCSRLADAIATHGDIRAAELFRARAITASGLLAEGWTQTDLNELGGEFPDGAWWLNPKALDYDAPREAWQDDVAILHQQARMAALDLRAIATLYPR